MATCTTGPRNRNDFGAMLGLDGVNSRTIVEADSVSAEDQRESGRQASIASVVAAERSNRERDLSLALGLADIADGISIGRFRAADLALDRKENQSLVTDADRTIELVVRERVRSARPTDSFLGEEFGQDGSESRTWMVDPIDGTVEFSKGALEWATLIGLCEDQVPVVGVVSSPARGLRWWGALGVGAWANGLPISVSRTSDLARAVITDDHRQRTLRPKGSVSMLRAAGGRFEDLHWA